MSEEALANPALDRTPLEPPLVPSTPYNGWAPDWSLALLGGVDAVRWGGPPRLDPLANLLEINATAVELGAVTFTMPLTEWLRGSDGEPAPGILAVLADHTLSGAVLTTLPPLRGMITIDLTVSFLDSPHPEATRLSCAATASAARAEMPVLAAATVADDRGRVLAHAVARCAVFEIPAGAFGDAGPPEPPDIEAILARAPTRTAEVAGQPLAAELRRTTPGLELLRGLARGEHPPPPIYHLTGLRPIAAEPAAASFAMPASAWLGSFTLNVQGGVMALLAAAASGGAVETTLAAGESEQIVSLRIGYARPVPTDEGTILAKASILHRGQSVAFSQCAITDPEGQQLAFAAATHAL